MRARVQGLGSIYRLTLDERVIVSQSGSLEVAGGRAHESPLSLISVGLDGRRKGVMELRNIVFHNIVKNTVLAKLLFDL